MPIHLVIKGDLMIKSISLRQTRDMMIFVSQQIIANQENLNDIDRVIGDGDHGIAMTRGFEKVIELLKDNSAETIAEIFLSTGNEFLASVGGASGIIFGTFFRSGSKALMDKQELDSVGIADFLQSALEAIMKRGGAQLGGKSMVDALHPAAMKAREMENSDLSTALHEITDAAYAGMENTKSMKASIGRAKTYGDASLGHPDPGAVTTYLILKSMGDFVRSLQGSSE